MEYLLNRARGLYLDRQRIALAAMMIVFSIVIFLFYGLEILSPFVQVPEGYPSGPASGIDAVIHINTIGLAITLILMTLAYTFWSWAFLPSPAVIYTIGVLKGIFGSKVNIKRRIGKRFRISIDENTFIDILCKIKERGSDEWFIYRLSSSSLESENLKNIALRHGMTLRQDRFLTWVSSDELHHRLILLVKAITITRL
jgi:hypothetical protein